MELTPGELVDGKYRVVCRIGSGGMGTVYEGLNVRIDRRVAIKVLHPDVASVAEFAERFEREARAAARIRSPYICDVLDLGEFENGQRFLVMEYLEGIALEDRMTSRPRHTPAQLAPIAFELLDGLAAMHGSRIIHRDLKPANIFLARTSFGRGEVVKILDFGVAKILPLEGEVNTLTKVGLVGTPLYMSPEQARGQRNLDERTDLYSASVIFYQALTGEIPHESSTLQEVLFKIALEPARPIRDLQPDLDEEFASIIERGMAREVKDRYDDARAYQEAIAAWAKKQNRDSLRFLVSTPPPAIDDEELPPPSLRPAGSVRRASSPIDPKLVEQAEKRASLPDLASSAPHAWADTPAPRTSEPALVTKPPPPPVSSPPRRVASTPPAKPVSVPPFSGPGRRKALTFGVVGAGALATLLIVAATRSMGGGTSSGTAQPSADAPIEPASLHSAAPSATPVTAPPTGQPVTDPPPASVATPASPAPVKPVPASPPSTASTGAGGKRPPQNAASGAPPPPAPPGSRPPPAPTDSTRPYRRTFD